jgi:hypothetical protein
MINWRSIAELGLPTDNNKKYLVTDGKDISTTGMYGITHFKGDGNPTFTFTDWSGDDNTCEYNDCCSGIVRFEMKPTHWCPIDELTLPIVG